MYICVFLYSFPLWSIILHMISCAIQQDFVVYPISLFACTHTQTHTQTHTHTHNCLYLLIPNLPGGSISRESTCDAGDPDSIPGRGRSPGEGNGYSLQYPCLGNPMDPGAWWAPVHRVAKTWMRLNHHQCQTLSPSLSHHCLWQPQICSESVSLTSLYRLLKDGSNLHSQLTHKKSGISR